MDRIFVIGNGGSGKTWLTKRLAEKYQIPAVHLDDLHWLPGFVGERPREERDRLVTRAATAPFWVMEGVYGAVLKQVSARVTTPIWLDLPVDECLSNLSQRGQTGGGTDEQFEELLEYTRGYHLRKNLNSFEGHQRLFEEHPFQKFRVSSRSEIALLLAQSEVAQVAPKNIVSWATS